MPKRFAYRKATRSISRGNKKIQSKLGKLQSYSGAAPLTKMAGKSKRMRAVYKHMAPLVHKGKFLAGATMGIGGLLQMLK